MKQLSSIITKTQPKLEHPYPTKFIKGRSFGGILLSVCCPRPFALYCHFLQGGTFKTNSMCRNPNKHKLTPKEFLRPHRVLQMTVNGRRTFPVRYTLTKHNDLLVTIMPAPIVYRQEGLIWKFYPKGFTWVFCRIRHPSLCLAGFCDARWLSLKQNEFYSQLLGYGT